MLYGPLKAIPAQLTWSISILAVTRRPGCCGVAAGDPVRRATLRRARRHRVAGAAWHARPRATRWRSPTSRPTRSSAAGRRSTWARRSAWRCWPPAVAVAADELAAGLARPRSRRTWRWRRLLRHHRARLHAQLAAAARLLAAGGRVLLRPAGRHGADLRAEPADEPTTFIFTNSWADPLILAQTFAFPVRLAQPAAPVQPHRVARPRRSRMATGLRWWVPGASWDEHWEALPQGNVILLRRGPDGQLERVTGIGPGRPVSTLQLEDTGAARRLAARAAERAAAPVSRRSPRSPRATPSSTTNRVFDPTPLRRMRPTLRADGRALAAVHAVAAERGRQAASPPTAWQRRHRSARRAADRVRLDAGCRSGWWRRVRGRRRWCRSSRRSSPGGCTTTWSVSARASRTRFCSRARATAWRAPPVSTRCVFPQPCPPPRPTGRPWSQRAFLTMINSNKALPQRARAGALVRPSARGVAQARLGRAALSPDCSRPIRGTAARPSKRSPRWTTSTCTARAGTSAIRRSIRRCTTRARRAYRGTVQRQAGPAGWVPVRAGLSRTRAFRATSLRNCSTAFSRAAFPVYSGAPDVAQYVPPTAFIDARQFASYPRLEHFLRGITEADARRYVDAAHAFLASPAYEVFCAERFARDLVDVLVQVGHE